MKPEGCSSRSLQVNRWLVEVGNQVAFHYGAHVDGRQPRNYLATAEMLRRRGILWTSLALRGGRHGRQHAAGMFRIYPREIR